MSLGLVYPVLPGFVENDLGGVVEVSSYSMAFFAGGCFSLIALVVSRTVVRPQLQTAY